MSFAEQERGRIQYARIEQLRQLLLAVLSDPGQQDEAQLDLRRRAGHAVYEEVFCEPQGHHLFQRVHVCRGRTDRPAIDRSEARRGFLLDQKQDMGR